MEYVEHRWINPGVMEKREYQENIVKTAITGNTLCVLPTGLGKTSIAALVAAHRLEKDMNKKILFMAPTKPLVEQHRNTFEKFLKIGPDELKVITGSNKPEDRYKLYEKADIVFSTPQTIRNDLMKGRLNLKDFSLLIVDEAHRCVGDYAYVYVAKRYMEQAEDPLILALTASPGSFRYKIDEVKRKLFIDNIEIRTRDDEDVKPYVQELYQNWVRVELPISMQSIKNYLEKSKEDRIKKLISWNIISSEISKADMLKLQQQLAKRKTGFNLMAMSVVAEIIKIDHALTLLETQCLYALKKYFDKLVNEAAHGITKAAVRLVRDQNIKDAMRLTTELINEGREHPKIEKLKEIITAEITKSKDARVIVFAQYRDTITKIYNELKKINGVRPVEFIGQAKKGGKGLSQREQVRILNEFKFGFYNTLLATQIGEEGLDIEETDTVIFYEGIPSAVRKIQRTGRTARTRPGKVIILITKGTRDEAYYWSGHHKERKMKKVLEEMRRGQKSLNDIWIHS